MVRPGPYATLLVLSGALALGLAAYAWRSRDEPGALPFVGLMIAVAGWSLGYGAGVSTIGVEARKFWTLAQWLFLPYVPVCWLLFALEYAGHGRWVTARSTAALAAIPAAATVGALTNDLHGLMWHGFVTNGVAGLTLVSYEFGPLLVGNAAYAYALTLAGTVLIARVALGSGTLYADQASALMIGIAVPWAANVLVMLRQVPVVGFDYTPFAWTVAGVAFGNALVRYRLFDRLPATRSVAHRQAVEDRHGRAAGRTLVLRDVTERRRRRELERLERVNAVVRDVNRAIAGATGREEVERTLCRHLVAADGYRAARVYDRGADGPTARATGGADPDDADRLVPPPEAFDDPGVAAADDPPVAHVPLQHGRTNYGVLALAADPTRGSEGDGFGERELEVLREFGETVGYAINAGETRKLLLADSAVELEFDVTAADDPLVALAGATGATLELDGVVPAADGELLLYLVVGGTSTATVRDAATDLNDIGTVRSIDAPRSEDAVDGDHDPDRLVECLVRESALRPLIAFGAGVVSARIDPGNATVVVRVAASADVRTAVERTIEAYPGATLLRKCTVEPTPSDGHGDGAGRLDGTLTDRQREALEAAYRGGYYEWPRDATAEEVADGMGIASPTLHRHLRSAHRKLAASALEEDTAG